MDRQATPAASSPQRHRIRNALLLATCAERLAAPLRGIRLPSPAQLDAVMRSRRTHPSPSTRQSSHLLLVALHLAHHGGYLDADALADTLAQRLPPHHASFDTDTAAVLDQIARGVHWWHAATSIHNGQGSYGSAAAVRSIAVGLLPQQDLAGVAEVARRAAAITHAHPWAHDGAAVTACAVALAAQGLPSESVSVDRFLAFIASQAQESELEYFLTVARTLSRHRAGVAETLATLDSRASILRAVPAALTAFLRYPGDPLAAIRHGLALGGSSSATPLITAALAGARNPAFATPHAWQTDVDAIGIHTIANALADLQPAQPHHWHYR